METFIASRDFVDNPRYLQDRQEVLALFDLSEIDEPISEIINGFTGVSHCFPLHSCYGHFLYSKEQNSHNLNPLPSEDCGRVRYRIAYAAFCIENSTPGRSFRDGLANIPMIAPDFRYQPKHFGTKVPTYLSAISRSYPSTIFRSYGAGGAGLGIRSDWL